jgi:hypothetical protein
MQGKLPTSLSQTDADIPRRYTWDGVIHKVEHLQYHLGLRYMADEWDLLTPLSLQLQEEKYTE